METVSFNNSPTLRILQHRLLIKKKKKENTCQIFFFLFENYISAKFHQNRWFWTSIGSPWELLRTFSRKRTCFLEPFVPRLKLRQKANFLVTRIIKWEALYRRRVSLLSSLQALALNTLSAEAQTHLFVFAILAHCANDNSLIGDRFAKSKVLERSTLVGRLCIVSPLVREKPR